MCLLLLSKPLAVTQAALGAFTTDLRSLVHRIAREIIQQATFLQNWPGHRRHSLVLQQTAGHEGIPGKKEWMKKPNTMQKA